MTHPPTSGIPPTLMLCLAGGGLVTAATGCGFFSSPPADREPPPAVAVAEPAARAPAEPAGPTVVQLPQESWAGAGIDMKPAEVAILAQKETLTGKITLNEDRVAHIFPLVSGRVDTVMVGLGDRVKKGQEMAIIESREVGQAMLQLVQDRLQLSFATRRNDWLQQVADNTQSLIGLIRANTPIDQVNAEMHTRPLGDYRQKLMSAYIANDTAKKNLDRLAPLQGQGIVAARQIFEAEAAWTTTRAALLSLLEQSEQDVRQEAIRAEQHVEEIETRLAVDETTLKILGFEDAAITDIDPSQGSDLAHCPVPAPFDGTVISKDVALLEHVGPTNQILSVADLGTVWLVADVYEKHMPFLTQVENAEVTFHNAAWPDKTFTAKVFYTGDIVNPDTRTISMRAVADNTDGLLKPGMFVTVDLPGAMKTSVLQVPRSAVFEHGGVPFVFVHAGGDAFERRDITRGRSTATTVEILSGISPGDAVVVSGGFALKSRMLADLLGE